VRTVTPLRLDRVTRAVGSGDADARAARARLAALSEVSHPGVCVPLDVRREDDAVVACAPRVPGVPLDRAGRVDDLGAWAWLVAGLAEALDALHARGLAHGDVSPANVVIGARPVLVDLVGPALGREHGTPGFASPERAAGGAPGAADDIHALGATCLAAAGESISVAAEAWMAPLLTADPQERPSAGAVARGIARCASPRRWLIAEAASATTAPRVRTERDPRAWHWRLARRPWLTGAVAVVVWVLVAVVLWWPDPAPGPPGAGPELTDAPAAATSSSPGPVDAARALTAARVAALSAGDGEALVALTAPGTDLREAAAREALLLESGLRFAGLEVDVGEARLLATSDDAATVEVAYAIPAHTRTQRDEETRVPATQQVAVLELTWTGAGWRVAGVSAAP